MDGWMNSEKTELSAKRRNKNTVPQSLVIQKFLRSNVKQQGFRICPVVTRSRVIPNT